MMSDSLDDVADSTDWLSTPLSGLAAVEAALRCQVCKDFYKTPMLTTCNHTFCSVCIRRALSNDGKCPLCRASEQELKLRSNWSMEETVDAFVKTRQDVLEFARKPALAATVTTSHSPKRKRDEVDDEVEEEAPSSQRSSKRLRSSTRLSKSRGAGVTAEMARQEADVENTHNDPEDYEPNDGLVACPVCLQRMKENQVFRHLDTSCPGEPQTKTPSRNASRPKNNTSSSFPSGRSNQPPPSPLPPPPPPKNLERLPAINYSMLKEQQLRKKLQELGISMAGSRQMLERRHKEWMTIWNANCDSLHPRRKAELLHDLDVWERTLGTRAPTSSRSIHLGAEIRDKNFDGAAWAAKHDTSFKDLIADARKNRAKAQKETGVDKNAEKGPQQQRNSGPGAAAAVSLGAAKEGDDEESPAGIPPLPLPKADGLRASPKTSPTNGAVVDLTGSGDGAAAVEGIGQVDGVAENPSLLNLLPRFPEIPHLSRGYRVDDDDVFR